MRIGWVAALLVLGGVARAADDDSRYFKENAVTHTKIYDLQSVKKLYPWKFEIAYLDIDEPEVMRVKLQSLGEIYSYCKRPAGEYAPSRDLVGAAKADLPIQKVTVHGPELRKYVTWGYPFSVMSESFRDDGSYEEEEAVAICGSTQDEAVHNQFNDMATISNGVQMRVVLDCDHNLIGYVPGEGIPAIMVVAQQDTYAAQSYVAVCMKVLGKAPYLPPYH